jgi:hypothetical protein
MIRPKTLPRNRAGVVASFTRGSLVAALTFGGAGCAQEASLVMLTVRAPEDLGALTITLHSLDGLPVPGPTTVRIDRTAAELRDAPAVVEIPLDGPREVMVVLSATGTMAPRLVAQRCLTVAGTTREPVWLVPLGPTEDADGDGYPRRAVATCARLSGDTVVPCASDDPVLCSGMGEVDCDDDAAERYPGAPEVCANGIDEDCDGEDTRCTP